MDFVVLALVAVAAIVDTLIKRHERRLARRPIVHPQVVHSGRVLTLVEVCERGGV